MKRFPLIALLVLVVALASVLGYTLAKPSSPPVAAEVAAELEPILAVSSKVEEATFPLTITDDLNRQVTINGVPQRIISIAPSCTEILFALGLGEKVVGVSNWCDYPEEAKAKSIVGSYFSTSLELIVAQQPDLVLTDGHDPAGQQLEALGLALVALQPEDIAGILENIALVGKITGKEKEAGELIDELQKRVSDVAKKVPALDRPWVFYEIDATNPTAPWTAGPGSFINSLITLAGGQNIVRESEAWPQVSLEAIIMAQPEIIILGDTPYVTPEDVKQRSGAWQELNAVKGGKIYAISDPALTSRPGPRIVDGLEEMVEFIHPELSE